MSPAIRDRSLCERVAAVRQAAPEIESIAVLPFENLSHDPEQEYFADGMTEELITNLGKISALRVISRTSVMQYKGTRKPLPQIARELNVDAIVEGTVQRSENRVRITANLLHAPTDRHLWAERYERDLRDVLALQRRGGTSHRERGPNQGDAAGTGAPGRSPPGQSRGVSALPVGTIHWNKRTDEGLRNAVDQFQRAVAIDPTYAPAYAGLADSYLQLANNVCAPPTSPCQERRQPRRRHSR